jgi:hypothetical protein
VALSSQGGAIPSGPLTQFGYLSDASERVVPFHRKESMTTTLTQLVAKRHSEQPNREDYWFLTGAEVPANRKHNNPMIDRDAQIDHFKSRSDQAARLDSDSVIVVSEQTVTDCLDFSAAMAKAIDQLIAVLEGRVNFEQIEDWIAEYAREQDEATAEAELAAV